MDINRDIFLKLPHEILIMIIAFLPFIDSYRLCLLRKEWHNAHLWLHCCSFELSETSFMCTPLRKRLIDIGKRSRSIEIKQCGKMKFIDVVNKTFTSLVSPVLSKFSFKMSYASQYRKDINKWVNVALSKNVEELTLDFSDGDPLESLTRPILTSSTQYPLPEFLYKKRRSIRILSLNSCSLGSCNFNCFFLLKSLSLTRVEVRMGELTDIVTSCPLLETLSLVECQLVKVYICFSRAGLKRLIMKNCFLLSLRVELCLPTLEYFEYTGTLMRFKMTQVDSLKQAVLNFPSDAVFPFQSQEIIEFFSGFESARILTICSWALKVFPDEYMYGSRPLFQSTDIQHLILMTFMERNEIPGILCLLKCSPQLKTLSILLGTRKPIYELFHYDYPQLPDALWTPIGWGLAHLQKVDVDGFSGKQNEFNILKFLIRYSRMPLEVTIKPLTRGGSSIYSQTFADLQNMENAVGRVLIRWY